MPAIRLGRASSAILLSALLTTACTADTASTPAHPPATTRAATGPSLAPSVVKVPTGVANINFAVVPMTIKGKDFGIEVADSDDKVQRGLMYRESMPDDRGMIFFLGKDEPTSFWMKNTLIPLDIIFLDKTGKVVQIDHRKPLDETGGGPTGPVRYVIELNVNGAEKIGLKVGDIIQIPDNPRK